MNVVCYGCNKTIRASEAWLDLDEGVVCSSCKQNVEQSYPEARFITTDGWSYKDLSELAQGNPNVVEEGL